MAIVH